MNINKTVLTHALQVAITTERREAFRSQPANLLLQDEEVIMYECKFCGQPSEIEPSEQTMPPDYCHPEDHQS